MMNYIMNGFLNSSYSEYWGNISNNFLANIFVNTINEELENKHDKERLNINYISNDFYKNNIDKTALVQIFMRMVRDYSSIDELNSFYDKVKEALVEACELRSQGYIYDANGDLIRMELLK